MVKLQKHKARENNYKYVVVIPEKNVEDSNLKQGDELTVQSTKGKLILEKKK